MATLTIGRLALGRPPTPFTEPLGDPLATVGGAVVPGSRAAPSFTIALATYLDGSQLGSAGVASGQLLRRQLRAMMNNSSLKLQGFFYVVYNDDLEQNGWYAPDATQLTSQDNQAGFGAGLWQTSGNWYLLGRRRTHREGRQIWMKALGGGQYPRDYLGLIQSTDFSALPALQLSVLPNGAIQVMNNVSGQVVVGAALPTGRDGGISQQISGQSDLTVLSYERAESALNLSDVIVYDRRGNNVSPTYGVSAVTDPSTIANLAGWWKADAIAGNDGDLVSSWADSSGHGLTGTAAGSQRPTLKKSVINGLPVVRVAASQWLDFTAPGVTDFTVFVVHTVGAAETNWGGPLRWQPSAAAGFGLMSDGSGVWQPHLTTFNAAGTEVLNQKAGTAVLTPPVGVHIQEWEVAAGVPSGWQDGIQQPVAAGTTAFSGSGGRIGQSYQNNFAGDIGEILVFSRALTDTERQGVENYLAARWYPVWEEVYGPDYPWNWLTAGQPNDCPVLDNGLVRVRYDGSVGVPGFRVDVWNGSAYVEQGKMYAHRSGDLDNDDDTWVSASLVEYTPDRATLLCVLRVSADAQSRERVYITMERGALGCTFEEYPALKAAGTQADAHLTWAPALTAGAADLNMSAAKIDSQGSGSWVPGAAGSAVYVATAGTGAGPGNSGPFVAFGILGASSYAASENWTAILRYPSAFNVIATYQATLVVLQGANANMVWAGGILAPYGVTDNAFIVVGQNAAGYVQTQLSFAATQADQVMEAESMTLGANTITAAVASSSGTGNNATTATRTTDANAHVTRANWPNSFLATYRVFVRVKVSASTGHFYAKTGATTGAAVTTTSTSYVWLDLGEIVANNTTLEIHAWLTAAATVTVDRVEAVLVQDRVRGSAIYSGARDAGQAALQDSRTTGRLVAR